MFNVKIFVACLLTTLVVGGCSTSHDQRSIEEQERAFDWKGSLSLELRIAVKKGEFETVNIESYACSSPLNEFAEQLFDMSFSGDADVYAPTLFGDYDPRTKLDPKALVEALSMFDTVQVMDVLTGEPHDTIIDMSFNKTALSSMLMRFRLSGDDELQMTPTYVALGTQIFNPDNGERRGVSNKFFLRNMGSDADESADADDFLIFYTDSLGFFAPHSFAIHPEVSSKSMLRWFQKNFPGQEHFTMTLELGIRSAEGQIEVESVRVSPRENEKNA
ncbi:MAG: hypothetical protein RLP15_03030 [Cryomorphaceae bacterium]